MKWKQKPGRNTGWAIFWLTVYLLSLIPILILAEYNYPCADDYSYSVYTRWAWTDTHSIFAVLAAAAKKTAESWRNWQGTFSSVFLMALQPGIFGERFYAVTPWMMLGALSLSIFFLFRVIFRRYLHTEAAVAVSAASIYLFFAVQCMIDPTQGIFWYNGSVHYMVPQAALFGLTALAFRFAGSKERKDKRCLIPALLLTVYIGGGNLVTGLECGIWLVTGLALLLLWKKRKQAAGIASLLAAWVLAFGFNAAAPGNWVREEEFAGRPGVIKAVLQSFYYCLEFFSETWHSWILWAFVLLMAPAVIYGVQRFQGDFSFPMPLLVPLYSFCVLSSMFTPSLYASGDTGAGRIYNIIWLTFLLLIVINMIYIYGWFWKKYGGGRLEDRDDRIFRITVLAVSFFCAALYVGVDKDFFTSVSAVSSLISGEAAEYRKQEEERLSFLLDDEQKELVFTEYTVKPHLLFYEDIESHPRNWKNLRMTEYYRKNSIVLMENGEDEGE